MFFKQGMRESNSHQRFWRPLSYHLTNPLHYKIIHSKLHTDHRLSKFFNANILASLVRRLIDRLPEVQRTIMLLRDIEGTPYADIARIMQLGEGQVRVYLHRARGRIKRLIEETENYGL